MNQTTSLPSIYPPVLNHSRSSRASHIRLRVHIHHVRLYGPQHGRCCVHSRHGPHGPHESPHGRQHGLRGGHRSRPRPLRPSGQHKRAENRFNKND